MAATNRIDILDPALLRAGRIDRKVEFGLPNEQARVEVLQLHSSKMKFDKQGLLSSLLKA
jgi:26S proteasome regulatory subunit T5